MKQWIAIVVLMVAARVGLSADGEQKAIELPASEAVLERGAEFQAVAQAVWQVPAAAARSDVRLGLKVTNKTGKAMQVNVFDTVSIVLKDGAGKSVAMSYARKATRIPEPLIIGNGKSQTIERDAKLEWLKDGAGLRLFGFDGTGGAWNFDGLKAGKYTLSFTYENNDALMAPVLARDAKHVIDPKEAPFWTGKAATKELSIEITEVKAAGARE